jgi:hypothetical protein
MKNRIINGDMRIDQRNAGASVSAASSGVYTLDRWDVQNNSGSSRFTVQQNAGSVTPPAGFSNYLGVTSTGAYSISSTDVISIRQKTEGYNTADFAWGTADAKSVTFSFWVRSSLTGTFGAAFRNSAVSYSYPFSYTILNANTWEQKTVTITGATSTSWANTNSASIEIYFSMGTGATYSGTAGSWSTNDYRSSTGATSVVGTSGATWYVTGVQLEVGASATSFDYREYGTELRLCQRYYQKTFQQSIAPAQNAGYGATCLLWNSSGSNNAYGTQVQWRFPVLMRAAPTVTYYNPMAANASARNAAIGADMALSGSPIGTSPLGESSIQFVAGDTASGPGHCCVIHAAVSAEL